MTTALSKRFRELRPLDDAELAIVQDRLEHPAGLDRDTEIGLRYAIGLARIHRFRVGHDAEHNLERLVHPFRDRLTSVLEGQIQHSGRIERDELTYLAREIRKEAAELRGRILRRHRDHFDAEALDREICQKTPVLVLGGGGGTGYAHLGGLKLLDSLRARPGLIVGTSMGAIVGAIRSRDRDFSIETAHSLATLAGRRHVFKFFRTDHRYGLPAAMRLYLRRAIGDFFRFEDGSPMTMADMTIPLEVVVAGVRAGALEHDVDYYERALAVDHPERPGAIFRSVNNQRASIFYTIMKEFLTHPRRVREIVLGRDELTAPFDVVDAIGFSAAVPGVIHYDVVREDPRMHELLGRLLDRERIVRIVDGGIVNNVPSRVAWESVQGGRIGTRNAFIVAFDTFAPQLTRNAVFAPVQQLVRRNTKKNEPYAHFTKTFLRVLSPLHLVPEERKVVKAIRDGERALGEDARFLEAMLRPLPGLDHEYEGRWPASWNVAS